MEVAGLEGTGGGKGEKGGVTSSLLDSSNRWEEASKAGGASLRFDMFLFFFLLSGWFKSPKYGYVCTTEYEQIQLLGAALVNPIRFSPLG